MPDREKVKKALDCRANDLGFDCRDCAYYIREDTPAYCNFRQILRDALALLNEQDDMGKELTDAMELVRKKNERIEKLLKEQEAVTIKKTKEHGFGVYGGICPKCRNWIQSAHSFCGFCGQAVKWE